MFSCKFAAYFQNTPFPKNTSGRLVVDLKSLRINLDLMRSVIAEDELLLLKNKRISSILKKNVTGQNQLKHLNSFMTEDWFLYDNGLRHKRFK